MHYPEIYPQSGYLQIVSNDKKLQVACLTLAVLASEHRGDGCGDGNRFRRLFGMQTATNGGHPAGGDCPVTAKHPMNVGDALLTNAINGNFDRQFIFETSRTVIIATGRNPRPTDPTQLVILEHVQAKMPEQIVLGLLHVHEERREMNDPGSIGLDKLDAATSQPANSSVIHHRADHSPTYGSRAMNRARLIASVTAC